MIVSKVRRRLEVTGAAIRAFSPLFEQKQQRQADSYMNFAATDQSKMPPINEALIGHELTVDALLSEFGPTGAAHKSALFGNPQSAAR
jgi:hypothetical protein